MSSALFFYEGPATIGGVAFDHVSLHEERHPFDGFDYQRSWEGVARIPAGAAPPLFGMPNKPSLEVELPDGRKGKVNATARRDDGRWSLEVTGEGPAPGCSP